MDYKLLNGPLCPAGRHHNFCTDFKVYYASRGNNRDERAAGKRAATLRSKKEGDRPAKRHAAVQTSATTRPTQDASAHFVMMLHYKNEAELWEKTARLNEIDNTKKDLELEVLERVNATHLRDLEDARATLHHLWDRNDHLFGILTEIARNNHAIMERYMPWMTAETPPASPFEQVDLTSDEE